MGLIGMGRKAGRVIGRGLGSYMEEEAKRQHSAFERQEYLFGLSQREKKQIMENIEFQQEFDNMIYKMAEQRETIPKIVDLDLRR